MIYTYQDMLIEISAELEAVSRYDVETRAAVRKKYLKKLGAGDKS